MSEVAINHGSFKLDIETKVYGIDLNDINCLIPREPPEEEKFKPGKFDRSEFDALLDVFLGIGRGDSEDRNKDGTIRLMSLAEMLAKRVAGRHNKNVIFILFGDLGSGKSMMLLKLALSCAMWLAALKGGKPSDYFKFSNIAVIDPEMLQEKLANLIKYNIYLLDDAGPGYDARTFMSKNNRDLNYILQTCRTSNNIILVSAPHGAMLDVTIHRVAQYYAEVSEVRHDEGLTFLKVFRLVRVFREGKIYYVYMTKGNTVSKRYYCGLPPKPLKVKYDKVRDAQAKVIAQRRAEREAVERAKQDKGAAREQARLQKQADKDQAELEKKQKKETERATHVNTVDAFLAKRGGVAGIDEIQAEVGHCSRVKALEYIQAAGWQKVAGVAKKEGTRFVKKGVSG